MTRKLRGPKFLDPASHAETMTEVLFLSAT
jgi:hypothetical protein